MNDKDNKGRQIDSVDVSVGWGSISNGGSGVFCDWSSIGHSWGSCDLGKGSSIGNWGSGNLGYRCGSNDRSGGGSFFANDGVESVDGVGGVVDDASSSISFQERVATLDYVSVAALLLALGVAGQAVVHVVGVAVLGMRVVVGVHGLGNHSLSHWSRDHCLGDGGCHGNWRRVSEWSGMGVS